MTRLIRQLALLAVCGVALLLAAGDGDAQKQESGESEARKEVVGPEKGKGNVSGTIQHKTVKKYRTLVFVDEVSGQKYEPPEKNPVVDQRGKKFRPHVLPVLVGTTVEFLNSDDFEHNVFCPDGDEYNLGNWGKGERRSRKFENPGVFVQLCAIHPEMVAYIVVLKTPYFAFVKKDGTYTIPNVPPGEWKLKVWNERLKKKSLKKNFGVKVAAGETVEVNIKP